MGGGSRLDHVAVQEPVDIVLNKRAIVEDIKNFGADYVILATGANMEPFPFDTGEKDNLLTTIQLLNGMEPQGERILIMGGGITACETAVYLARQGKSVTLCARRDAEELDTDFVDHNNRDMLLQMVKAEKNITVLRSTIPARLENGSVVADQNGIEKKIPMDSLIFAGRLFPENELSKSFENTGNVFSIGDCAGPNTIMDAVWGAFNTVRKIEK